MRRVFSRRKRRFLVLGRGGGYFWVLPHSGGRRIEASSAEMMTLQDLFPAEPLAAE